MNDQNNSTKTNQNMDMESTMLEIEQEHSSPSIYRRERLQKDIQNLEQEVKTSQDALTKSNKKPFGRSPLSPEQANESLKNIVFLKKDISAKQDEYGMLD